MRMIRPGDPSHVRTRPWWARCVHECPRCGALWELDPSDAPLIEVVTARSPSGESTCQSTCPSCGNRVMTLRSQARHITHEERWTAIRWHEWTRDRSDVDDFELLQVVRDVQEIDHAQDPPTDGPTILGQAHGVNSLLIDSRPFEVPPEYQTIRLELNSDALEQRVARQIARDVAAAIKESRDLAFADLKAEDVEDEDADNPDEIDGWDEG